MLDVLLGSKLRAKALGWLFTHTDERCFVRQLTTILGEDSTNLSRELARLAQLGVLTCQQEGRQKYYRANPDCPVFAELKGLAVKTAGVSDVLREALAPLAKRIRVAFVYGSLARGEEGSRSDVDVLIVGKVTFDEVVQSLRSAEDRIGREVNPGVYSPAELRTKLTAQHPFLTTVLNSPKIFLIGDQHDLAGLAEK
jgi:predicted nucleotidyltransferase